MGLTKDVYNGFWGGLFVEVAKDESTSLRLGANGRDVTRPRKRLSEYDS